MPLDNPTAVNPFNGRSDDAVAASQFEKLYDAGAFNPDGKPDPAQGQAAPDPALSAADRIAAEPSKEGPGKATAAPESEDHDEPEYVNFDDYLQKAGLERDAFLQLPVRIKDADVPLADVLKRFEADHDVESQSTALTERQKAWETESAQQTAQLQERLKAAETLGNIAYQQLLQEYQGIDWNRLSQEDPARWAVLQTQFNQRVGTLQNQLQQIQAQHAQTAQDEQAKRLEGLKGEQAKLLKAIPEWRDPAKFEAARTLMSGYSKKLGFTEEEVNAIFDHRYMRVLNDAAQWNRQEASKALALKKVRAAPVASNPGARITRDPKVTQLAEAKKNFAKNPRNADAQLAYANQIAQNLA